VNQVPIYCWVDRGSVGSACPRLCVNGQWHRALNPGTLALTSDDLTTWPFTPTYIAVTLLSSCVGNQIVKFWPKTFPRGGSNGTGVVNSDRIGKPSIKAMRSIWIHCPARKCTKRLTLRKSWNANQIHVLSRDEYSILKHSTFSFRWRLIHSIMFGRFQVRDFWHIYLVWRTISLIYPTNVHKMWVFDDS